MLTVSVLARPAKSIALASISAVILGLTGCGGGGGGGGDIADGAQSVKSIASDTVTESAVTIKSADDVTVAAPAEYYYISSNGANGEVKTNPALFSANGVLVTHIDAVPEGLANSPWAKKTTGRLPLRVMFSAGTYVLSKPWTWSSLNSGRSDSPITIEASTPGSVIISGATTIAIPRSVHQGQAKITQDLGPLLGNTKFEQVWVNGVRATRARSPNVGSFYYVNKASTSWNGQAQIDGIPASRQAFTVDPASATVIGSLTEEDKKNGTLIAFQSWNVSHHRIGDWAPNSSEVKVSPAASFNFLKFGISQRYFIENVASALDAPGEWYVSDAMRFDYIPTPQNKLGDIYVTIPRVSRLVNIAGRASMNQWVEYLNFKGLTFRYTSLNLPAGGFIDPSGGYGVEAAIYAQGARNISISDSEVSRVGGNAIWFAHNVLNSTITNCEIFDTGAGGIVAGLNDVPQPLPATTNITITNNRIHSIGHQFPAGVGIYIARTFNNRVEDNLIGDTTYSGIFISGTYGYGAPTSGNNQINRNFLYDLIQNALSDGGGIYTLGDSPGTQIKGNVIKNVRGFNAYGAGTWGLYNDEGSTNILMSSNIISNTDSGGYHQHYGGNNTISNNVFANGTDGEIQFSRTEGFLQGTFTNNLLLPTRSDFFKSLGSVAPMLQWNRNSVSRQFFFGLSVDSETCAGQCVIDNALTINDGQKLDVPVVKQNGRVVSLPDALPAQNWATSAKLTATTSPAPQWAAKADQAPKRQFSFDASTLTVGTQPSEFMVLPAEKPELVSVIKNSANESCLAFKDSPNNPNSFDPRAYAIVNYTMGTTVASFTLKSDSTTEFVHEWRDKLGAGYKVGPSMVFSASKGIFVNGKRIGALPIGEWLQIDIAAKQGAGATWNVRLTYKNGTMTVMENLEPYNAGWTNSTGIAFISDAVTSSTPCIGKVSIFNQ